MAGCKAINAQKHIYYEVILRQSKNLKAMTRSRMREGFRYDT